MLAAGGGGGAQQAHAVCIRWAECCSPCVCLLVCIPSLLPQQMRHLLPWARSPRGRLGCEWRLINWCQHQRAAT